MAQATANEQFMLELVNNSRKTAGLQPLAMNSSINTAADLHTDYQLDVNKLTHTGLGGTTAYTRMKNAGYDFNGSSTWGENVGWQSIAGTSSYQDEIVRIHEWLMNSPGHRANLLNASFREVGIGFSTGPFLGFNSAIATQDFAKATGNAFVTGVAFDDKDGDRAYDVGEGLGTATVTARNTSTGAVFTTSTGTAGGYSLSLAAGTYSVTFSETGYASKTSTVTMGSSNVKVDWVDPATSSTTTPPPPPPPPSGGLTLTGTSSSETLTGGSSNDVLKGLAGNDTLNGGAGADTMYGGAGSDKFYVDNAGDIVSENTKEGVDTVYSTVSYTLRDFVENLTLTGSSNLNATGNSYHNILTGNAGANVLRGGGGDDTLVGGAGTDTAVYAGARSRYSVTTDSLGATIVTDSTGSEGKDRLTGVEKLQFSDGTIAASGTATAPATVSGMALTGTSSSETLTGGSGDDVLKGLAGNDTLKGSAGADTMYGGTGSDKFYVDDSGDLITEYTKEGVDTVYSTVDYTLRNYIENLTLSGAASNDATGNSYHNVLIGNSGANLLSGLAGDDTLSGGTGTDKLSGGSGADTFDWNSTAEAGKGTARDVILDMVRGSDEIDLGGIDANSSTTTDDAFKFIGNDTFNSVKGELRFYDGGAFAVVQGDVNGDRVADFELTVQGTDVLSATDFVL